MATQFIDKGNNIPLYLQLLSIFMENIRKGTGGETSIRKGTFPYIWRILDYGQENAGRAEQEKSDL